MTSVAASVRVLTLSRCVRRYADAVGALEAMAVHDSLTGVMNRRGFLDTAEREVKRARRYGHPLGLAYADVRGLKTVNDTQGHAAGDAVLRGVAGLLSECSRSTDLVGRLGGDEMAVLLVEQSAAGVEAVASRLRSSVQARRDVVGADGGWDLTLGTAIFPDDGDAVEELLAAADRRLYMARGIELN